MRLGDNKVVYLSPGGKTVVLKLKTAPDVASGILDQYELGPYNLIILGAPTTWRGEIASWFTSGVVQQVDHAVTVLRPRDAPQGRQAGFLHLHRRHLALHAGRAAGRRPRPFGG